MLAFSIFAAPFVIVTSCTQSDSSITNAVKTATEQAILHVPAEFQPVLADYLFAAAKGVYSIDGTPTVNELIAKVLAFIPKDVRDKYPLITTTVTTTITLVYLTYGKTALTAIGKGLEAGAINYITKK